MKDFETWYLELIGDQIWSMPAMMQHKEETFKQIARKVYMSALADRQRGSLIPMTEHRRHVYNIICKTPGDRPKGKPWYEKALEKKLQEDEQKEEWKPVSEEEREQWLKKWQEQVSNSQMVTSVPRLTARQIIEEGDWRAVSTIEPRSDVEKAMVFEEHIEKVNAARRKVFTTAYPDASEEEIQAYLKKFDVI